MILSLSTEVRINRVAGIRSRGFPEESLTSYKSVHEMVVKGPHLWHKARREGA